MLKTLKLTRVIAFSYAIGQQLVRLLYSGVFRPKDVEGFSVHFAELYSLMFDLAEQSVSNLGFDLPAALGDSITNNVNRLLATLYGGQYACLSYGGSSGAILALLVAVLPKLHPDRTIILFDEMSHQSAIGGLIFGRWKAVKISRVTDNVHGTTRPVTLESIKILVEKVGVENIAAIFLVTPTYDGFRLQSEETKIFDYAKDKGITLVTDGAWGSTSFYHNNDGSNQLASRCDVLITSPHKRGLCPSSLGCIVTNREDIARVWDEALDLGFRSSSISFVETMVAEHRISQVVHGKWDRHFEKASLAANTLRQRISEIHSAIYVVEPKHVGAESADPAHILISTSKLKSIDARLWAYNLSEHFAIDVEKATSTTLLLLCASPVHFNVIDQTLEALRASLQMTVNHIKGD